MSKNRAAVFIVGLVLLFVLPTPQAQASSVVEKFPTETTLIFAGWTNPTSAYAHDESPTYAVDGYCEQEYSGFNFNFNETDTVEKILMGFSIMQCSMYALSEYAEFYFDIKIWNGSAWFNNYVFQHGVGTDGSIIEFYDMGTSYSYLHGFFDVTNRFNGSEGLENVKVRLFFQGAALDWVMFEVDYVSVEVVYTTSTTTTLDLKYAFLLIGIPLGFMFAVPILYYAKANREQDNSE